MNAPRLEVDLSKVADNARSLVARLAGRGIAVTGVTKAVLGAPELGRVLFDAGVQVLGDSRIENLERLRHAAIPARLALLRSPMLSQLDRVVRTADISFNTEPAVIAGLSDAARDRARNHGVVLMVELGDLREGLLPADLPDAVRATLRLPNLSLEGLGTNLACRSGVVPDAAKMAELSALVAAIETTFGIRLPLVSGGNSANLGWALGHAPVGRINDLRLGESLLLGLDPLDRSPIDGLHTDAITLVAEVIESKVKPSVPWGRTAQTAFGSVEVATDRGLVAQCLLAIGEQDVDPLGLLPPPGTRIVGASSDHLVVISDEPLPVGAELRFFPNYSALLRAMTSPFVATTFIETTRGKTPRLAAPVRQSVPASELAGGGTTDCRADAATGAGPRRAARGGAVGP
ncbi:MAG: alanine/ornithine racemase family PLP-dependent enzyme [Actinobacteria bacterium]|jgi:predicted amino acid racemase|nr:alanine/ornithine racemase family PLP-dependent enzyme [Actinomycetota bacterium]